MKTQAVSQANNPAPTIVLNGVASRHLWMRLQFLVHTVKRLKNRQRKCAGGCLSCPDRIEQCEAGARDEPKCPYALSSNDGRRRERTQARQHRATAKHPRPHIVPPGQISQRHSSRLCESIAMSVADY